MRHIVTLMLACSLIAGTADAGVIRGTLYLSRTPLVSESASGKKLLQRSQRTVEDGVIYVERIPDKAERKLSGHGWFFVRHAPLPHIVQQHLSFTPRVTPVTAGGAVAFENLDRVYHETFSISPARQFDLGKHSPGQCDTVTFDHAGVINLHCAIHPQMTAYIVVVPNHAFTRPDRSGAFALPGLPGGTYVVHAWHPRWGETTRQVELPGHGDCTIQVAFAS